MSKTRVVSVAFVVLATCAALAAPAHAVPEDELEARFESELLPFCLDELEHGSFVGVDGVRLAYARLAVPAPRGALVVLPGRSEPLLQFCELVHDLRDAGHDIYLLDHRGQGWSERLLPDGQRAYVDEFDDLVDDLGTFVREIVRPDGYAHVLGFGHSMGGAILTRHMQLHPDDFTRAVLSAPMHAVDTNEFAPPVAYAVAVAATLAGKGGEYAPGEKAPDPLAPLAASDDTHSGARWNVIQRIDQLFPELAMGGSTFRWVREALEGTATLRFWAWTLCRPLLVFQADDETYVDNRGQDEVCARAHDCVKVFLPGSRHNLPQERDAVRDVLVDALHELLATM